ncbi:tRNA-dihydrouridine(47) synthase [Arthroderma uncinatum]|uniref:tRNA-dihydrouridine(47) synthase n=1 Tax=Arthroderma uncinatum TaxID=74035 RepID=UPI00144ACD8A|nr:tRNA-dihydrouridine(47) synthase [Arthroderma uncinatum]KAF3481283.1 tRNA-dihydrouridine(47) synthase [Arthroderma uncinatum]
MASDAQNPAPSGTSEPQPSKGRPLEGAADEVNSNPEGPSSKRVKLDEAPSVTAAPKPENGQERRKGLAPIKAEYIHPRTSSQAVQFQDSDARANDRQGRDDDEAEAAGYNDREGDGKKGKNKRREKNKGKNTNRRFQRSHDERGLCGTVNHNPEFSPKPCQYGDNCKFEHDLRKYLKEHKKEDLKNFGGICPVWEAFGVCSAGWRCRFVGSHMTERELEDGRKELVLVEDEEKKKKASSGLSAPSSINAAELGVVNLVSTENKQLMTRKKFPTPKADKFNDWINITSKELEERFHGRNFEEGEDGEKKETNGKAEENGNGESAAKESSEENKARYTEPPFLPSEKRRLYFGPETPVLAPLTTQGNLPFRRLCVELGAQFTYSEMAMSVPLIQGTKGEWALMKAHESEILPPTISPKQPVVQGYEHSRDMRFGAQIAGNRPWQALKATEILTALCPHLRVIDLNCGCPIDLVYRDGAGSALLEHPSKLEKILRGMNSVSGEVPITAKIRMGTKDNYPTALKLAERLVIGGHESNELGQGPAGIGALTLHGRSRQQRYSRAADWGYISECSALVKRLNEQRDEVADTIREPDERLQPSAGKVFFLGNGDCYSHADYNDAITNSGVDSVMVARGALVKPWIFEEIQAGQYMDKSSSERLTYIERFVKHGLEAWGSDEHGVGTTRRFLLEWLSFTCRYVPIGILEYLPPSIQDRPPAWRGRDELETLLASDHYLDWIKISEMFLGPADKDFKFTPKHKSNSYDVVAEG